VGVTVMYLADPDRGRRRRAGARDWFLARWHGLKNELDKAERDLLNRSHGLGATASSLWKHADVDGPILVERVRSAIGRSVSHPHGIHARVEGNRRVVLEGPILRHEVDYLVKRVAAVRGVKEVANHLQVHADAGGIASLQGGVPRRSLSEFAQQNWTPSLRVASVGLGGTLLAAGLRTNTPGRWMATITGASLLARGIANKRLRQIFGVGGGAGAITFDKTIHINAPLEEVYAYWANFENFPKFMTHLKEVRHMRNGRSHWVAAGPGGISIPWDAEVAGERINELLAWRSVPGSVIRTSGTARFEREEDGRTRVQIRMSYCPPAGLFGHAVAWMFGADPKSEMDEDLVRLKSLLETGKTRAHGMPVSREQIGVASSEQQQRAW